MRLGCVVEVIWLAGGAGDGVLYVKTLSSHSEQVPGQVRGATEGGYMPYLRLGLKGRPVHTPSTHPHFQSIILCRTRNTGTWNEGCEL